QELARVFCVALGEQLHRTLHVCEQDRHLLALALKRRARGENALGEMRRGVRAGRSEPRGILAGQARATGIAEAAGRRVGATTRRTGGGEGHAAGIAEASVRRVVLPALRTRHPPQPRGRATSGQATVASRTLPLWIS